MVQWYNSTYVSFDESWVNINTKNYTQESGIDDYNSKNTIT